MVPHTVREELGAPCRRNPNGLIPSLTQDGVPGESAGLQGQAAADEVEGQGRGVLPLNGRPCHV